VVLESKYEGNEERWLLRVIRKNIFQRQLCA
jgi:hypothetical protein